MSGWAPAKYKTTNRSSCNDAVKQRGSLSIRFDPGMVRTPPPSAEFHRCRDPNLPDHEGAVWYATPPDDRVGAEPVATGRSALGRTRFQHLVSQAEDTERDPSVSRRHRPAQPADCPTRCLPGLTGLTGVPPRNLATEVSSHPVHRIPVRQFLTVIRLAASFGGTDVLEDSRHCNALSVISDIAPSDLHDVKDMLKLAFPRAGWSIAAPEITDGKIGNCAARPPHPSV